jgi:hypothetical protein
VGEVAWKFEVGRGRGRGRSASTSFSWVGKPLSPDRGQVSNHTMNVYTISMMIVSLSHACK